MLTCVGDSRYFPGKQPFDFAAGHRTENTMSSPWRQQILASVRDRLPRPLRRSMSALRDELHYWRKLRSMPRMLREVAPYTMVDEFNLAALCQQVVNVVEQGIPGDFVECGVWRGGCSILIAKVLAEIGATDRKVWLVDSFEGLPPPTSIDGPTAISYAQETNNSRYFDNCKAEIFDVKYAAEKLAVSSQLRYLKGWFENSLPAGRAQIGPIALLRIDADWYTSVMTCLDNLYDQVSPGGIVILDDYYTWDGCSIATHEFLAKRKLAHRLERHGCAFFRKA